MEIRLDLKLNPQYEETFREFCKTLDRANELLLRLRCQAKEILVPVDDGNKDMKGRL